MDMLERQVLGPTLLVPIRGEAPYLHSEFALGAAAQNIWTHTEY
jgi:hypothetical protein